MTDGTKSHSAALDPSLSLWLDFARVAAALMVVAHHVFDSAHGAPPLAIPGRTAVIVFFVISGFVISHAAQGHAAWVDYAAARAARIYSVALPALALTGVLFYAVGMPGSPQRDFSMPIVRLLVSTLFINQSWNLTIAPLWNGPYWSLCFEVWYYVLFGVALYAPRGWRLASMLLVALVAGPRVLLLLPVWLLGVGLQRALRGGMALPAALGRPLFGVTVVLLALALAGSNPLHGVSDLLAGSLDDGYWKLGPWRVFIGSEARFPSDFYIGLVFAATVFCSRGVLPARITVGGIGAGIRTAASFTFSIYLYHAPILIATALLIGSALGPMATALVLLAASIGLSIVLGLWTERRSPAWRPVIKRLLQRVAMRAPLEAQPRGKP